MYIKITNRFTVPYMQIKRLPHYDKKKRNWTMQQNASLRLPDFLNDKKTDYTYSPNGLGHRKDQLGCSLPWPNGPIFACLPPKHSPRTGSLRRSRCWRDRWHVGITHFIFIRCAIIIVGICLKPVRIFIDQFNQHLTLVMIKTAYSICNMSNSNLIWSASWIIKFFAQNHLYRFLHI